MPLYIILNTYVDMCFRYIRIRILFIKLYCEVIAVVYIALGMRVWVYQNSMKEHELHPLMLKICFTLDKHKLNAKLDTINGAIF